jgi:hypothetical protein
MCPKKTGFFSKLMAAGCSSSKAEKHTGEGMKETIEGHKGATNKLGSSILSCKLQNPKFHKLR